MGKGAVVGLIDSGVDASHQDLGWHNRIYITSLDGLKGVQKKYASVMDAIRKQTHPKILPGWNFLTDTDFTWDVKNHGTAMAGIIAAEMDGIGMVGIAPLTKIRPYIVLDKGGRGRQGIIAKAIDRAIVDNVDVINLSLEWLFTNNDVRQALKRARDSGIISVAAAGNHNSGSKRYPAGYDDVIAVAGCTASRARWVHNKAFGSNYGEHIWCAAPAAEQDSTQRMRTRWTKYVGTSLACANMSGVVALLKSIDGNLTLDTVKKLLKEHGSQQWDKYLGWGVPDVAAMLRNIQPTLDIVTKLENIGKELLELATLIKNDY